MYRWLCRIWNDERGASLAIIAVSIAGLLSVLALAIDLGMLFTARAESQRVADAAALAGASAFLDIESATDAVPVADARARDFATQNVVRNVPVANSEVTVQVIPDSFKVRVWVNRGDLPLWFARVFGVTTGDVGAMAAAQAVSAGAAKCVAPLAVPDIWHDVDDDLNNNRHWDGGETWEFDPEIDHYERYEMGGVPSATATGYGSAWRNGFTSPVSGEQYVNDYGRQIILKPQNPQSSTTPNGPGWFYPWQVEGSGADSYKKAFWGCSDNTINLGEPQFVENGNMVGPTRQAIDSLLTADPNAQWDPENGVVGSAWGQNWIASPRVLKIALFDPIQIKDIRGKQEIVFNNFAYFFVEDWSNAIQIPGETGAPHAAVTGRFLYFASGVGTPGPDQGSLVRTLRLVE